VDEAVQLLAQRRESGPSASRAEELLLRDFRSYERAGLVLGPGLTVIFGPNGAGKTNLLEALYFGCTGRSCRAGSEREVVRFGTQSTRVVVRVAAHDGEHELAVGFAPGEPKRLQVDGTAVESLLDADVRPLLTVFLPERLELVKGPPAVRRAHLDQLVAALWPARVRTRRLYSQTLAQRNALIARMRASGGSRDALDPWDAQLARHGIALMADRADAVEALAGSASELADELGLGASAAIAYRPRSRAGSEEELAAEIAARTATDLERGFSGHGPHRDDLALLRDGRELRTYGSQGQQRLALLALLLAEREAVGRRRGSLPILLLDDVMSELDHSRRLALSTRLRADGGQALLTASELEHVPGGDAGDVRAVEVTVDGALEDPGRAAAR
jgi:DNA replication and repair protein RecF